MPTKLKPPTNTAKSKAVGLPATVLLEAAELLPHPLNPRPWSDHYQCHVHDEKVEELIHSMVSDGYDQLEPIQVRQLGDNYQIIVGHHRYCAARQLKIQIPAVVLELDDVEVALRLVLRQGRSIDPWDLAKHAHQICCAEEMCSQVEYGNKTGYSASLVSKWIRAIEVREATKILGLSVTACATIARAPMSQWLLIAENAIAYKLGTRDIEQLVGDAQDKIDPPVITSPEIEEPQKTVEIDQHLVTKQIPNNVPTGKYPPVGHKTNLKRWKQQYGTFDLVLLDCTVLREENDQAMAAIVKLLNKSGRAIFVCEPRHSIDLLASAQSQGLEIQQKLIWHRGAEGNSDDLLGGYWPNVYREILIFKSKDLVGYFEGLAAAKHFGMKPSDVIKLAPTVNGGISATLSEFLYRSYAPPNAHILIPAAYEAQAILAGYRLDHHVTWLEASEPLFESIIKNLPC